MLHNCKRYAILTPQTWPRWKGAVTQGVLHILKSVKIEDGAGEFQLGKTMLFIKAPESVRIVKISVNQND